jgi:hypothetical protein
VRRHEFEHVVRAAASAVGLDEFVIIGSQAIHGEIADPPAELLESMEVDMYPLLDPDSADVIDAVLGDGSWFEYTNGYFAHAVSSTTGDCRRTRERSSTGLDRAANGDGRAASHASSPDLCASAHTVGPQ